MTKKQQKYIYIPYLKTKDDLNITWLSPETMV